MTQAIARRVLVTGATGFLGGAVARRLVARGVQVVGQGRAEAHGAELERDGVEFLKLELGDLAGFEACLAGVDAVVHCAALSAPFGPRAAFEAANVEGTAVLLEAMAARGTRRLVHVSTPSLYCAGRALVDVAEDCVLPAKSINAYAASKRRAEQLVSQAPAELERIVLRPRAIFGPGDSALFPRLLRALSEGGLPVIGAGRNLADLTYVDNAAHAVELALGADEQALGRTFNVTDGAPVRLWELIEDLCERLELPKPGRHVSRRVARGVAGVLELSHRGLRRDGEPRLTRYGVDALSLDATLDISAARRWLGYAPQVSTSEGVDRFVAWWREQAA